MDVLHIDGFAFTPLKLLLLYAVASFDGWIKDQHTIPAQLAKMSSYYSIARYRL